MNLESVAVSNDTALLGVLRTTLEKMAVNIQVCPEVGGGKEVLATRKFDAVIIDCDDLDGGVGLLQGLRQSQSNGKSVAFAVLNGKTTTQEAFRLGANFVLQKPLMPLHARRCFHAALNFMLRERRRYYRFPVDTPVHVRAGKSGEFAANSTNLSESGIAIRVNGKLEKDTPVELRFTLPSTSVSLELKGRIAWADGSGLAGIQFQEVPQSSQYHLDKWLTERLQSEVPTQLQGHPALA